MQLAGYRSLRCIRFPGWIVALSALLWALLIGSSFVEWDEGVLDDEETIHLMYVDTELRLLEAGRDGSPFVQWLTGASEEEETLEDLRDTMERYRKRTELYEYGSACLAILYAELGQESEALAVLRASVREGAFPSFRVLERFLAGEDQDVADVDELRDAIETGANYAWEVRIFRHCGLEEEVLAELPDYYDANHHYNGVVLHRALVEAGIWIGLGVLGLVCLVPGIAVLRRGRIPRYQRTLTHWAPGTVVALFFCSWLAAGQSMGLFAFLFEIFEIDSFRGPLAYGSNLLVQAVPMLFMMFVLLERPRHLLRFFLPRRSLALPAVIMSLGLLGVLAWVLYLLSNSWSTVDPTDFLDLAEPSALDLAYGYLSAVLFAPIVEEVVCRGFLFLGLRHRLGTAPALLLSSALFALLHVQYDLSGLLSVFLFGVVAALLAWRTGSILPGIVVHALYNLILTAGVHWMYHTPL